MNIVVLDGYTLNPGDLSWKEFEAIGSLTVHDRTAEADILPRIGDAQAVFTNKTPLSRATLERCPALRYVGVLATGYNVVDVAAARELGITVTNIPTYGTAAVAQLTFALVLELCHHVGAHSDAVHAGVWQSSADFCFWNYPLVELAGKTLGLVGLGRIGRSVADIARAFGMAVAAYDPAAKEAPEGIELLDLEALLARADILSLHCPLTESTQGLINRERLLQMKDGAWLINTARGPLIVEEDVAEALRGGKLGAAAVDVVSSEPIQADNPLLSAHNCIITPHIAWAPLAARKRLMGIALENLRAFLDGKPVNVVS